MNKVYNAEYHNDHASRVYAGIANMAFSRRRAAERQRRSVFGVVVRLYFPVPRHLCSLAWIDCIVGSLCQYRRGADGSGACDGFAVDIGRAFFFTGEICWLSDAVWGGGGIFDSDHQITMISTSRLRGESV